MSEPRIITTHVFPPIPIREFDWCAYYDPEGPCGYGRTEQEAINDLLENYEHEVCAHCGGSKVEQVYGGHGNVLEFPCSYCCAPGSTP